MKEAPLRSLLNRSDPDGVRGHMQYLFSGFFPVEAPSKLSFIWTGKVHFSEWPALTERCKTTSLRQAAREYGVSYEAMRRALGQVAGAAET